MRNVTTQLLATAGILAGCLGLVAQGGCSRNPVSGRPQAVVVSEKGEIEQGKKAAKMVEEHLGLVEDPALNAYIDSIGQRLAAYSPRTKIEHEFYVVDMVEPNAFALPGGHIYVSRGLLALVNDESELATVIGHEIGHVAARHSVTRQTASVPMIPVHIASALGGWAVGIVSPGLGQVVQGAGSMPGSIALAKYGRNQESEADRLGQEFAADAGWDPKGLASFMHSLTRETELHGEDPDRFSFFQSHPTSPDRSAKALEFAATLETAKDKPAPLARVDLLGNLSGIVVGTNASEGVFIDERFLHPELRIGCSMPEGWTYYNLPNALVAQHESEKAMVILELAGEGKDPVAVADEVLSQKKIRAKLRATRVGGLRAAETDYEVGSWGNKTKVHITWIASGGLVYQIRGVASDDLFDALWPDMASTVASFHELSTAELAEIRENHLRIGKPRQGETLDSLIERSSSQWSKEQTEVANALEGDYTLEDGELIKLALPEAYVPRPRETETESE
jgi:predicted Zn-dependent protease